MKNLQYNKEIERLTHKYRWTDNSLFVTKVKHNDYRSSFNIYDYIVYKMFELGYGVGPIKNFNIKDFYLPENVFLTQGDQPTSTSNKSQNFDWIKACLSIGIEKGIISDSSIRDLYKISFLKSLHFSRKATIYPYKQNHKNLNSLSKHTPHHKYTNTKDLIETFLNYI